MQAVVEAMAAYTILSINPATGIHHNHVLFFPGISNSSSSTSSVLHSSFHGVSLKVSRQFQGISVATAAPKPLTVVAATKKAVAVLKGTSNVEGVVTLTQDDNGLIFPLSLD